MHMSICLDFAVVVGYFTIKIADLLSNNTLGDSSNTGPKSLNRSQNHLTSDTMCEKAIYSISQLDLDTRVYFLATQLKMLAPYQMLALEIETLLGSPAQSESQ